MARKDVFISGDHDALRTFLVGQDCFFGTAYELLAFAASVGWEKKRSKPPPANAKGNLTVQMFDDNGRADTLLADVVAVLGSLSSNDDSPVQAAAVLNADQFGARCEKLCAWGHGGLAVIEELAEQHGGYTAAVLKLLESSGAVPEDE